ncbi:TPA: terminase large subunit, partial [Streptococcus pyogenes]|nr:terminase large subunit [Streptococcus pyogenes]
MTIEYDYSAISDIYKDDAFYYAKMVVDEQIKSSKKVFRACLRHLNDLKKIDGDNFKFIYLPEKAADPINFIEILPDVKTGKPYPLAMFQKFIIGNLYGWRKKTDHSLRRFRKAMISVARKNGKTILIAGILL